MEMLFETWYLLRKDLLIEWRSREILVTMGFFTILSLVVFGVTLRLERLLLPGMTLQAAQNLPSLLFPGILWVTLSFAGTLGMGRTYATEQEGCALDGLRVAPLHREAIYLAKQLSLFLFSLGCALLALPLGAFFFRVSLWTLFPQLLLVLLLGLWGFSIVGTFLATLLLHSRLRQVLLPLIFLPVALPLIVAGAHATAALLQGDPSLQHGFWLRLMLIFDLVFFVLALWLFPSLLDQ